MSMQEAAEAIQCFKTALKLRPGYKKARDNLSRAMEFAQGLAAGKEPVALPGP